MGRKRERKRRKRPKANSLMIIDEEKLARLEAAKAKREETIARVRLQLENKFKERSAINAANTHLEEVQLGNARNEPKSSSENKMAEIREEMKIVMTSGVENVHAAKVLQDKVKFDPKSVTMSVYGKKYKLKKNVHVVGWGCEALMMASTFEKIIHDNLKRGWLVVPRRTIARMSTYPEWFPALKTRIILSEAESDETPDDACVRATKNIAEYCKKLKKKDILVVMLASSSDDLLCLPKGNIGWREKFKLLQELEAAGASPSEISVVRKTLSAVRGGGLSRLAYPAKVISFVMSNLGADDLHLGQIVDGPTSKEDTQITRTQAQAVLEKYGLHAHNLSHGIREVLQSRESAGRNAVDSGKVDDDKFFSSVSNCIAASSKKAIEEMAAMAFRLGYVPIKLIASASCGTIRDRPSVRQVSKEYTKLLSLLVLAVERKLSRTEMFEATKRCKIFDMTETKVLEIFPTQEKWARGLYILVSPPPIVTKLRDCIATVNKSGINQEMALCFSLDWYLKSEQYPILKEYVVWFLGGSSGGRDGNTDYAGAYAYGNLGVDVYRKFKAAVSQRSDISQSSARKLEDERLAIHEAILPDRVFATGNVNSLFRNVNNGDELLKIGNAVGRTHTDVGNLHIFRVVRCQCSCDGSCLS